MIYYINIYVLSFWKNIFANDAVLNGSNPRRLRGHLPAFLQAGISDRESVELDDASCSIHNWFVIIDLNSTCTVLQNFACLCPFILQGASAVLASSAVGSIAGRALQKQLRSRCGLGAACGLLEKSHVWKSLPVMRIIKFCHETTIWLQSKQQRLTIKNGKVWEVNPSSLTSIG